MFLYFEMLTGNGRICSRELDVDFRPGSRFTRSNEVTPRSGPDEPVIRGTKNERVYQQRASELAHKRDTLIWGPSYKHAAPPKSCFPAPEVSATLCCASGAFLVMAGPQLAN